MGAALIAGAVASCAVAPPPAACFRPDAEWGAYRARAEAEGPNVTWIELTGAARTRALGTYNASPPASAFDPDLLGYFDNGQPFVVLAMIERGCVWFTATVPRVVVEPPGASHRI